MKRKEKDIEKAALKYFKNLVNEQRNSYYNIFKSGAEWADAHPIHYDGKAYLYVVHKVVEQCKRQVRDKIENLIKEWKLCNSAEAKYRCEAYQELLDLIEKEE